MHEEMPNLAQRIDRLERELAMVRLQLRALHDRLGSDEAVGTGEMLDSGGVDEAVEPPAPSPTAAEPPRPIETSEPITPPTAPPRTPPTTPAHHPPKPLVPPIAPPPPRWKAAGARQHAPGQSLERKIGGQVFAVAGALIILIGLALAAKIAIDNGWFKNTPPSLRCLGIALVGIGFLGLGEFLRSRVRGLAIAGCNAVGIGALYIAAYAAFGVFGIINAPVAFALMVSAACVGFAVALRHGFLSTALLSLVGAYLVPVLLAQPDASPFVLLAQPDTSPFVLPIFVLVLSVVALGLAAMRPRPFGPMRDAAWIGTGLLGLGWTIAVGDGWPWLVLVFWGVAWVLHQTELLVTALRGELRSQPDGETPEIIGKTGRFRRRVEPVLLAITTTAGVVAIAVLMLKYNLDLAPWLAPAAGLAVTGSLALVFGGHLRVLRDVPRTDTEALAAAHAAQAGALLVTAVALACSGWVEATAWLAMGVAAVLAGRWIAARSLEVYGILLLGIASVRIGTYDLFLGGAGVPWTTDSPLVLAPWTVLIVAAGGAWMLVALLMLHASRNEEGDLAAPPRRAPVVVCAGLAVVAWSFAPAHPDSTAAAVCLAWLGLSLLVRSASRVERRLYLGEMGMVVAAASILPWIAASEIERWLGSTVAVGTYPGLWLGGAVAAVLAVHAWAAGREHATPATEFSPGSLRFALMGLATAVVFAATSMEVARAASILADDETARLADGETVRGAAVSIWWGLWGVSLVVVGFWRRLGAVRYVGLGLLSIAAIKTVVLDLAGVPPMWRVGSFVGLGGLMLAVAVLYGRVSASIGAETFDQNPGKK